MPWQQILRPPRSYPHTPYSIGARSSIDSGMSGIPPVPSFPSVRNAFCQSAHRNGRAGLFELPLPTVGPTDILCLRGTMDVPAHISSVRLPPAAGGRKRKETRNICRPALKAVCLCPLPDYCGSGPEDLYSKPASFQNGWGGKDLSPAAAHKRERKVFFLKKTYFNLSSLCTSSSPPEREGESKHPLPGTKLQGIKSPPPPFPPSSVLSLSGAYHKDGGEKRHYLLTRNRRLRPPQQLSLSLLIPPLLLPLLLLPQNFKRSFLSSAKAPPPTLTKKT